MWRIALAIFASVLKMCSPGHVMDINLSYLKCKPLTEVTQVHLLLRIHDLQ